MAAFAAAFVPAYSKTLDRDGPEVADRLAADAMATIAAFTVGLTLISQAAMPWLMMVISPGFGFGTDKYKLAVILTQITMPYLPCMAIAALLSGVLNARGKFIVSAAAPILLNLVTLIAVIPTRNAHDAAVAAYDRKAARPLARFIEKQAGIVFEAHSTDYQTRQALRAMVEDHFAVLKVGPWLFRLYLPPV